MKLRIDGDPSKKNWSDLVTKIDPKAPSKPAYGEANHLDMRGIQKAKGPSKLSTCTYLSGSKSTTLEPSYVRICHAPSRDEFSSAFLAFFLAKDEHDGIVQGSAYANVFVVPEHA